MKRRPAKKRPTAGARPPGKPRKPSAGRRPAAAGGASEQTGERLQKVLAAAGIASRRECEALILEGRIEVDDQVVTELGMRVDPTQQKIEMDGEAIARPKRIYYAVNKPEGVVCTARDPSGRPRVIDLLPPDLGRVFNVGRLDMSSDGLILLTNDGELANQLTHPKHGVEKIYHVQVAGMPTPEVIAQLKKGVYLAEGKAHFEHVKIKSRRKKSTVLEVVLDEGRNREIRRLLARVGHKVQKLTRVAVGPVKLGELPSAAYRQLTDAEVKSLRKAAEGVELTPRPRRRKPTGSRTSPERSKRDGASRERPVGQGGGPRKAGRPAAGKPVKKTAKTAAKNARPAAAKKGPAPRPPMKRKTIE
ncbi:pseudouridine synthase [Pirellulimonas nuda]|nr:pseudouridine synthase [Pirellulimonas nuda]